MTSRLVCYTVMGTDSVRHGDGVEKALYLQISRRSKANIVSIIGTVVDRGYPYLRLPHLQPWPVHRP